MRIQLIQPSNIHPTSGWGYRGMDDESRMVSGAHPLSRSEPELRISTLQVVIIFPPMIFPLTSHGSELTIQWIGWNGKNLQEPLIFHANIYGFRSFCPRNQPMEPWFFHPSSHGPHPFSHGLYESTMFGHGHHGFRGILEMVLEAGKNRMIKMVGRKP